MKRNKEKRISIGLKNRLKANGVKVIDESVTLKKVYDKYGGICQECECVTVYGVHPQVEESATIEHIVPISRGGNHTWENVSLLCYGCNTKRNHETMANPIMHEKALRFFGIEIAVRWRAA